MDLQKKLIDLMAARDGFISQAETAIEASDDAASATAMEQIDNVNREISNVQVLLAEKQRKITEIQASPEGLENSREERIETLMTKGKISYNYSEMALGLGISNSLTLSTGSLAMPTAVRPQIGDNKGIISSILGQVMVEDLTGFTEYSVPFLKTELTASAKAAKTASGVAPTASDAGFGLSVLKPITSEVLTYVDKGIKNFTPALYEQKVTELAMRALRKKVASIIAIGDGAATPTMYGAQNGTDKDGNAMCKSLEIETIGVDTVSQIVYAYGSDDALGGEARLYLSKKDLEAIGKIRGTNEKRKLFDIRPEGNGNSGTIVDGGLIIPYTLVSSILDIGTLAAEKLGMFYGNPLNYTLGLFGNYSVELSSEYKFAEGLLSILGKVNVGGNVTEHEGFVVAKKAAASAGG